MVSGRWTRKAASTGRPLGMYRAAEHHVDDSAVGVVDRIFTDDLGWMFTRNEVRECGIDGRCFPVVALNLAVSSAGTARGLSHRCPAP